MNRRKLITVQRLIVQSTVYLWLASISTLDSLCMLLLPGWLLKEHADILAGQVSDILNYSYHEGRLPSSWKHAYVFPVPKQKPVREVNKHLRPILLTPIFSKMSEAYVVDTYVKPAVLERIDPQQFGAVPKSSTTHALISM